MLEKEQQFYKTGNTLQCANVLTCKSKYFQGPIKASGYDEPSIEAYSNTVQTKAVS